MSVRKAARLFGGLLAAVAALGMAVSAQAQEKKIKIGVILRPDRPARGRRFGAAIYRRQDHARPLRQDRGRGLQGRGGLCRRPEQTRCRHQRGGAPDRAGKGRHAAGLLLVGAMRAGGRARRATEEVHVDHHLHFLGRARQQELQICLPPAGERRPVRADDDGFHRPELRSPSSARSRRTCASPSSTRTAPTASTSPRATRPAPRRPASTSC